MMFWIYQGISIVVVISIVIDIHVSKVAAAVQSLMAIKGDGNTRQYKRFK